VFCRIEDSFGSRPQFAGLTPLPIPAIQTIFVLECEHYDRK